MKKFFQNILSPYAKESSKRLAALVTLLVLLVLTIMATIKDENWQTPEYMFDALSLIVGGGLGLTVIEKIFTKYTPQTPPVIEPLPTPEPEPIEYEGEDEVEECPRKKRKYY